MTSDVAEMLVAAESLTTKDMSKKLDNALRVMDNIQMKVVNDYDEIYDLYLELYPAWRMYILCEDPAQRNDFFDEYEALFNAFIEDQKMLLSDLGTLFALQKALLPSNVHVDPDNRIVASVNIADILENF